MMDQTGTPVWILPFWLSNLPEGYVFHLSGLHSTGVYSFTINKTREMNIWKYFQVKDLHDLRANKLEMIKALQEIKLTSVKDIIRLQKQQKELEDIERAIQEKSHVIGKSS